MKKGQCKPILAAMLAFTMAFSGSGVSALAASTHTSSALVKTEKLSESGNAKILGGNPENLEDTQEKTDLSELTIAEIEDQTYTGSAIEPEVLLSDGDYTLTENVEYTVTYSNNTDLGTASITVTAIEGDDTAYSGSITVNFQIVSAVQNGVGNYAGKLAYFTNGKVDTSKNGLLQDPVSKNWYMFSNGYVNSAYSNLVKYGNDWYYVRNGKIDWTYTTLAQVNGKGSWYYVENGKLNWNYTGLAQNQSGWFYVKKGIVDWSFSGLTQYKGSWFYVTKGKLDWSYSNLVKYNGTWFYVHTGRVDWTYTTLAQVNGKGDWYYVKNGKIDWTYTGLFKYGNGWYYVEKGKVNWSYNSLVKYNNIWWSVQNGVVTFKQKGLVTYNKRQFYVENSQVNWNYTNLVNKSGWDWYYVEKGEVNTSYTGLFKYGNTWYYVENGKVNWDYTSLAKYNGTWYGVIKGKVDFTYTGLLPYNGKGFYVKKGVSDWSYNGKATLYGTDKEYTVKNGQATIRNMDIWAQAFSSDTNYLIMIDRTAHRIGIYTGSKGNWTNYAYWECVVGAPSTPTLQPNQEFTIGTRGLYFNTWTATQNARCWYWTQIWGTCYIHSQIYDRSSSPVNILDDTMDAAASHGCIRLTLDRAKWVYDNIPSGTKVYIYN